MATNAQVEYIEDLLKQCIEQGEEYAAEEILEDNGLNRWELDEASVETASDVIDELKELKRLASR